jgi:hypothetical protein
MYDSIRNYLQRVGGGTSSKYGLNYLVKRACYPEMIARKS